MELELYLMSGNHLLMKQLGHQIGTDSTYTLTSSEEGKEIRAIISYTDGQGFSESVLLLRLIKKMMMEMQSLLFLPPLLWFRSDMLSITESTADPDGTGTLSYVWQSSSDETTWTQIGTDSTYTHYIIRRRKESKSNYFLYRRSGFCRRSHELFYRY